MRKRQNSQEAINFQAPADRPAGVTVDYFRRYEFISKYLDDHRELLDMVHRDLRAAPRQSAGAASSAPHAGRITSDTVLRMIIVKGLENASYRRTIIMVDDSTRLRSFTRIHDDKMMDPSTLCLLVNCVRPETWQRLNELLGETAAAEGRIDGDESRIDTTATETNVHFPTDASLLWDTYRVLARLILSLRKILPSAASPRRLHAKRAKKLYAAIGRCKQSKTSRKRKKGLYGRLIRLVRRSFDIVDLAIEAGQAAIDNAQIASLQQASAVEGLLEALRHYRALGARVVDQAKRRVLGGEKVPNDEKLFSIFEPHTELLIRGKAGKEIEFGHMVSLQQVGCKFITHYDVFEKRPADHQLVDQALARHKALFGGPPRVFTADKGFWESEEKIQELRREIPVVSVPKKGKRSEEQTEREHSQPFRLAQRFRAGVEGTIAFMKRSLGMWRCMSRGFERFASAVGATVFVHNLLILARATT